jgi:hypothetical protein
MDLWGPFLCVIMHAYARGSVFLIWSPVGVLDMGSAHIGNQGVIGFLGVGPRNCGQCKASGSCMI